MSSRMRASRSFVLNGRTIEAFTVFNARNKAEVDELEASGLAASLPRAPGPAEPAAELPVVTRAGRETTVELEPEGDPDATTEPAGKRSSKPGPKETKPEPGPAELKD